MKISKGLLIGCMLVAVNCMADAYDDASQSIGKALVKEFNLDHNMDLFVRQHVDKELMKDLAPLGFLWKSVIEQEVKVIIPWEL